MLITSVAIVASTPRQALPKACRRLLLPRRTCWHRPIFWTVCTTFSWLPLYPI